MNILITGVAGFIGFNTAMSLLKKGNIIYGLDSLDNYYSIKFKKIRLKELQSFKNFNFKKIDLNNKKKIDLFLVNKKIDIVVHYAAQAGVRYSFENPAKYIDSNFFGFLNIVLAAKKKNVKKIIYASSSSVYGDAKNFPVTEKHELRKKNIYSTTKCLNEETAKLYNKLYGIDFIGLRFFTIFGEWGRPDMLIFKIFKSYLEKKPIVINNYGNHKRDFTYIGDVVKIVNKLINKKSKGNKIFNISSNDPINILDLLKRFQEKYKINIKYTGHHKADVFNTHGSNVKIKKFLKIKSFSKFYINFFRTFEWYKKNKINMMT
jgi:UDP-glucuronate 4-epimerase